MGARATPPSTGVVENLPTKGSRTIRPAAAASALPRTVSNEWAQSPAGAGAPGQVCREAWSAIEGPQL